MGRIYLDELSCERSDVELDACSHDGVKTHNCGHAEDAGVICIGWLYVIIERLNLAACDCMELQL